MMMIKYQTYWSRLKNPAVVMAIAGYILVILANLGLSIDNTAVLRIINAICSILILLGIMNNPETGGIDLPRRKRNL